MKEEIDCSIDISIKIYLFLCRFLLDAAQYIELIVAICIAIKQDFSIDIPQKF